MPKFQTRKPDEVPARNTASRAVQEQQRMYESFIQQLDGNVGELALNSDENVRSVKTRLRRAATRMNHPIKSGTRTVKFTLRRKSSAVGDRPVLPEQQGND